MDQPRKSEMNSGVFEILSDGQPAPIPDEPQKNVGTMYPGQRWIELTGRFTPENLRDMADRIEQHCAGVPDRVVPQ